MMVPEGLHWHPKNREVSPPRKAGQAEDTAVPGSCGEDTRSEKEAGVVYEQSLTSQSFYFTRIGYRNLDCFDEKACAFKKLESRSCHITFP